MTRLGILVIHGMGSQRRGYSLPFTVEVSRRLGPSAARTVWSEVYWADAIAERERELWECMHSAVDPDGARLPLDWRRIREFIIHNFGDAIAYQRDFSPTDTAYRRIHETISDRVAELRATLPTRGSPVVVVAHSLGAHIISNYIWDRQHHPRGAPDPLERLSTLCSLVTFGCTIPLFALAFPLARPINLPDTGVRRPALRSEGRWLNFLDRDDVLGWPIRPLYEKDRPRLTPAQRRTVDRIEEREIDAGTLITSCNPASHTGYWTDPDLVRPVADHLVRLIEAMD